MSAVARPAPNDYDSAYVSAGAEEAVRSMLKDPDSAEFKHIDTFVVGKGAIIACGWVNAKNGFGGYGGFKRFVSNGTPDLTAIEGSIAGFGDAWKLCQ